jgi:4,5-dihydroxyphthalate decarboxylase
MYPKTGPVTLKTNLADSALVAALKAGKVSSPIVKFDFCGPPVAHDAFKGMVRDLALDAGELAIVTYLQAKTYNKPWTLLPAVMVGKFQHSTISYMHRGKELHPKDMEGGKCVMRSYTQTTPTWARGVLQHEYGVDLSKVTWVTADDPHLAEYEEPANVVRIDKKQKPIDQRMIDGEAEFGVIGAEGPKHPDARRLIPDHEEAAAAWYKKYGCTHVNHLFVVRSELAQARPDVVEEIWRLLVESKKAAGLTGKAIDMLPFGVEAAGKSISIVSQYAHEQKLIPRRYTIDEIFDAKMRELKS